MKNILLIALTLFTSLCFGQTIMVDQNTKDTIEITEVVQTFKTNKITIKKYNPPVIVQPPSSKYFLFPVSNARTITGQSNIVIENLRFENTLTASLIINNSSNVIIRNCFFNKSAAEAIAIQNSRNITIETCLFNGVTTGVYASTSQTIKVISNQFINVRKRADGARGQFVQFNNVTGAGNEVSGNKGENFTGESDPEDLISMYQSSGISTSPILIKNNVFRGGGPSLSGGGILAGDHGGGYITVDGNTLLNPGQYGLSIAGGSNNVVTNNKILSKQFSWSNIAMYIWNQSGITCSNNIVKSNRATWVNKVGISNPSWNAGNCVNTIWEKPLPITEAELNIPEHLIDYVTPEELLRIRGK